MCFATSMLGLKDDDPDLACKAVQANYHMYLANARAVSACH